MATLTVLAMLASCLGWGLGTLRLVRGEVVLSRLERLTWAPVLGMGLSGWAMFPASLLLGPGTLPAWGITGLGLGILGLCRTDLGHPVGTASSDHQFTPLSWALMAVLAAVAGLDLANALVPPVDADSMAYHFALAKRYLAEGEIRFVPQAVEAAVPLLLHMTYLQALALGGETGLTLWCGLTSWGLPMAAFALAWRHLPLAWALFLLAAIKTMPAAVYGAPSGQIEVRLAALFLVAVMLAVRARRENSWRTALVAGLAAGFCAGVKYSGLVAPAVCGLALLGGIHRFRSQMAFGLAVLVAGGQWYAWNGFHTGDPLFPMLWGRLPYTDAAQWDETMRASFASYLASELGAPKTLAWLFYYPFKATFDGLPVFESGRTGFGPLLFILLPFSMAGLLAAKRARPWRHELAQVGALCLAGSALWFLGGSSQRVRHFLPEYIPLLVGLSVAAWHTCQRMPRLVPAMATGMAATLAIQLGGQAFFSLPALRHLWSREDRQVYLIHNVSAYPVVQWLNTHLGSADRILLTNRELVYHLEIPNVYIPPSYDGRLRLTPPAPPNQVWIEQLRALKITHLLVGNLPAVTDAPGVDGGSPMEIMAGRLVDAGCARTATKVVTPPLLQSRTLRLTATVEPEAHLVVALRLDGCEGATGRHGDSNQPAPRL